MFRRVQMYAVRWFFISLPFVGLAWIIAEMMVRNHQALLEIALDSEAFARAPVPPVRAEKELPHTIPSGLEVVG
jgi:hypothetical protein